MSAWLSSHLGGQWRIARLILSLFCTITLANCGPVGNDYLSNGIGAQLPTPESDIIRTSNLQNKYFSYLCQQAGIGAWTSPYAQTSCALNPINDTKWLLVVAQGMNDIDRRCDAYLQWLDNQKRSKGPIISQIGSIRAATTGIMGVAEASTKALTVAGLAFDLISQSVENYHSRLLLEIESSTVNSIVLNLRRKFREDFRQNRIAVTDRPQAEYILRSYLRLCLPFAIEANINNYSTLGSSGIAPTDKNSINWSPASGLTIGAARGGEERRFGPRDKLTVDPIVKKDKKIPGAETVWEGQLLPSDLKKIQKYFCIAKPVNNFGNQTRANIGLWSEFRNGVYTDALLDKREGELLLGELKAPGDCKTAKFKNVYERLVLDKPAAETQFVDNLLTALNATADFSGDKKIENVRTQIKKYLSDHPNYKLPDLGPDEITPKMYKRILAGS